MLEFQNVSYKTDDGKEILRNVSLQIDDRFVAVTGPNGSGKSTVAKILVAEHGYTYYSTGNIMRELAAEAGIGILEYNQRCVDDPTEDRKIDDRTREVAIRLKDEKLVFDSRMAWFFAPDTFKVYVTVDPATAARRVGIDPRPGEPASEVEIYEELEQRSKVEQARFIKFYGEGADYYDWNNFNLIVDSTSRTAAEVAEVIWQAFEAYQADPEGKAHVEVL